MKDFCLLHPEGKNQYFLLEENVVDALSLDYIVDHLTRSSDERKMLREVLLRMPVDPDIMEYRRGIYMDLKKFPGLCKTFADICKEMEFYGTSPRVSYEQHSTIWDFVSRLNDLSNYCSSIIRIKECLEEYEIQSVGLLQLKEFVDSIYHDNGFPELQADVDEMCKDISRIKSMSLGVNLDAYLNPTSVGIISLNVRKIEEQGVLKRYLAFVKNKLGTKENYLTMLTHTSITDGDDYYMKNTLTRLIEQLLPKVVYKMKDTLKKYVNLSGLVFMQLADDFLFYQRFLELEERLGAMGLPCVMADIAQSDTRMNDFYNLRLALSKCDGVMEHDIVCNDIDWKAKEAVLILTGPNRGGKTIFTQGLGLAYLLFQHGVFVPCSKASMRICDGIFTHFPVDENQTMTLGRLGEEAARFADICKKASERSLLLFNESFATTSHSESVYIARDALKYLCKLGAYSCFNTHMHELAETAESLGMFEGACTSAVSIVMENQAGERSYKIAYRKPDMTSFAHDIAYKYGITFEQLSAVEKEE